MFLDAKFHTLAMCGCFTGIPAPRASTSPKQLWNDFTGWGIFGCATSLIRWRHT